MYPMPDLHEPDHLAVPSVAWSGRVATLDTRHQGVPGVVAVFLVPGSDGRFTLVEAGPGSTAGQVERLLAGAGLQLDGLEAILVTHVHLDHAGAAGALAARSGATVYVHERGARHLADPSRLMASARRVFGERTDELWGTMTPVPAERIVVPADGEEVTTSAGVFRAVESPGHARHHLAYLLDDGTLFTGDAAAIRLPHSDVIAPAMPPPELDLDAWDATIDKLVDMGPERLFLTHYGAVDAPIDHLSRLKELHREIAGQARPLVGAGDQDWVELFDHHLLTRLREAGTDDELVRRYRTASPPDVSAMGLRLYIAPG